MPTRKRQLPVWAWYANAVAIMGVGYLVGWTCELAKLLGVDWEDI